MSTAVHFFFLRISWNNFWWQNMCAYSSFSGHTHILTSNHCWFKYYSNLLAFQTSTCVSPSSILCNWEIYLLRGRLTLHVLGESYRGETDPWERLSDRGAVHLHGPPWQPWPTDFQPGNTLRGQQSSTIPPLTRGCVCQAPVPSGTLCIVTVAGPLVIEVKWGEEGKWSKSSPKKLCS